MGRGTEIANRAKRDERFPASDANCCLNLRAPLESAHPPSLAEGEREADATPKPRRGEGGLPATPASFGGMSVLFDRGNGEPPCPRPPRGVAGRRRRRAGRRRSRRPLPS